MDLILLVIVLSLIGFAVWFFTTKVPMPSWWATGIQVIAFILVILFLLRLFPLPNVLGR